MLRTFNPKYMLFLRVRNIAFRKALSTEQYQSADSMVALLALKSYTMSARVVLQCRDSLQELALSDRVWLVWE
jgi:DNA polymerase IIIc chi subunit